MGCDIHMWAEKKNGKGFVPVEGVKLCDGRNYDLFAILANVRNGHGFAGVKTGEGFIPISEPRGVPDDATEVYREAVEEMAGDGHSHSYVTVAELLAYDWTQRSIKQGVVDLRNWAVWKTRGKPEEWSGGIWGQKIRMIGPDEILEHAPKDKLWELTWKDERGKAARDSLTAALGGGDIFSTVQWEIPYYHAGRELLAETLPQLWRHGKPEDIRLCFFFDN